MTANRLKVMASVVLALAGWLTLSAQGRVSLTNAGENVETSAWGTSRAETYDVAIFIDPTLFGTNEVAGFTFRMQTVEGMSACSGWMSKELRLESKVNVPDVKADSVVVADSRIAVVLPEPVAVGPDGIYVGVTFTMDSKETAEQKKPVTVVADNEYGFGMFAHSSRTYGKWMNIYSQSAVVPAVQIEFAGVPAASAYLTLPQEISAIKGEPVSFNATLFNRGSLPVSSMKIAYTLDGTPYTLLQEFEKPVAESYMSSEEVEITLPAVDKKGAAGLSVSLAEVNGETNTLADSIAAADVFFISFRPVHRPLLEEYTGLGCGYCPRGEVGVSKMQELHKDDFIAVAYHVSDIMAVVAEADFPNPAPAQPVAWISRSIETDPYFGNLPFDSKEFGIDSVWSKQASIVTPAELNLQCEWRDGSMETLDITSDFTFVRDYTDADFRMVYMLVADGLKGEGVEWMQGNYYSGETDKWPEEFNWLVESPQYISGLEFNNVLIYTTDVKGLAGSVPAAITADEKMTHTASIAIADAVNLSGKSLVQDKQKLSVVAALVDATDGHVVNSAKAVPLYLSVDTIDAGRELQEVRYHNLQGQRISASTAEGLVIKTSVYTDGTTTTEKLLLRR